MQTTRTVPSSVFHDEMTSCPHPSFTAKVLYRQIPEPIVLHFLPTVVQPPVPPPVSPPEIDISNNLSFAPVFLQATPHSQHGAGVNALCEMAVCHPWILSFKAIP